MAFNSGFKGLKKKLHHTSLAQDAKEHETENR
jgi:hypothetical protein